MKLKFVLIPSFLRLLAAISQVSFLFWFCCCCWWNWNFVFIVCVDLILLLILRMPLFHAFTNDAINYGCLFFIFNLLILVAVLPLPQLLMQHSVAWLANSSSIIKQAVIVLLHHCKLCNSCVCVFFWLQAMWPYYLYKFILTFCCIVFLVFVSLSVCQVF